MPTLNYNKHSEVLKAIGEAQDAEKDMRDRAKFANTFLYAEDGQWDPDATAKLKDRYRGTFDLLWPIIDGINGEIEESDFTITVSPSGAGATDDIAKKLNGIMRAIKNQSDADNVFNSASAANVRCGFDCVEVVQDYVDGDSFDQSLFIKRIPNAVDSVWFDPASVEVDRSDSEWAIKQVAIPTVNYKEKYPKGKGQSLNSTNDSDVFTDKIESITIGQFLYKRYEEVTLVKMSDGSVYKDDEKLQSVIDDLARNGITEEARRKRKIPVVYSRLLDGGGWLKAEEKTVFNYIPLSPIYGNFEVIENKPIYFGKVDKLFDHQKAFNYSVSRSIEDEALSPASFDWMTKDMAIGNESEYVNMNTDGKRVRIFNVDENMPGVFPQRTQAAQASQALQSNISNLKQMIDSSSNTFQAQQGNAYAGQSGIAGQQQIDQGNIGSIKWFKAKKQMEQHVAKILIGAIPKTLDGKREQLILAEDGTTSFITLNDKIFDDEAKKWVTLNDLTVGEYGVVCDYGPAFNSQQKETAQAFIDMASINPDIVNRGMDIWLKNMQSPGMDQMAERFRVSMVDQGLIPLDQMTEDEKIELQRKQQEAQNQPQQEDPMMVAARAEEGKAQAAMMDSQNKQQQQRLEAEIKMEELKLEREKLMLEAQKFQFSQQDKNNVELQKINQGQQKIDNDMFKTIQELGIKVANLELAANKQLNEEVKGNTETIEGQQSQP